MSKVKTFVTLTVMDEYELRMTDDGLQMTDYGLLTLGFGSASWSIRCGGWMKCALALGLRRYV